MKVCNRCGETYKEHIDFCFVDGDVLVGQGDAMDVPLPAAMRATGGTAPVRSGTPVPKANERSLIQSGAPAAYTAPDASNTPSDEAEAAETVVPDTKATPDEESDAAAPIVAPQAQVEAPNTDTPPPVPLTESPVPAPPLPPRPAADLPSRGQGAAVGGMMFVFGEWPGTSVSSVRSGPTRRPPIV